MTVSHYRNKRRHNYEHMQFKVMMTFTSSLGSIQHCIRPALAHSSDLCHNYLTNRETVTVNTTTPLSGKLC